MVKPHRTPSDEPAVDFSSPAAAVRPVKSPSRFARYAGYAAAWVAIITVGRLVVPQSSRAAEGTTPGAIRVGGAPAPGEPGVDVGSLVGHEYVVRVRATADGARYTVCRPNGTVLREGLDAHTLAEAFPTLDPRTKSAEPTRIMSADTDR